MMKPKSLEILEMRPPKAGDRIQYGHNPLQFGDLRVPRAKGPHPVVIYIHGGFWKAQYNLEYAGHVCAALTQAGFATWNLEYRRIGHPGGGWPGTFDDIKNGAAYLSELAKPHFLDLRRIVVAGHSSGGHLALWLAAQPGATYRGVVSIAGVADLKRAHQLKLSEGSVAKFLGGSPREVPARYASADPMELLPIRTPQRLIHGTLDDEVPFEISQNFARVSKNSELIPLLNAGHFEPVDPRTPEWKVVQRALCNWD